MDRGNKILDNYKSLVYAELTYVPIGILLIVGNIWCMVEDSSIKNTIFNLLAIFFQLLIFLHIGILLKRTFNYANVCEVKWQISRCQMIVLVSMGLTNLNYVSEIYITIVYYIVFVIGTRIILNLYDSHRSRYIKHPEYSTSGEQRYLRWCLIINIVTDVVFTIVLVTLDATMDIMANPNLEDLTVVTTLTMTVTSCLYLIFDCLVWWKCRTADCLTLYYYLIWYASIGIFSTSITLGNLKSSNRLILVITAVKIADTLYKFITYWLYQIYFNSTMLNDYTIGLMPINIESELNDQLGMNI